MLTSTYLRFRYCVNVGASERPGVVMAERNAAMRKREPSMLDVGRHAGVSGQTVSRVANGHDNVDPATRERVIAAMRELGYRPNAAARALRSGRFRSLGVILFSLSLYGSNRTLEAVATEASARGYNLSLLPLASITQQAVSGAFDRFQEQAVDGVVIVVDALPLDMRELELPAGLPVVVIDASEHRGATLIDNDQAHGAELATRHLLDLGHRTVHHLAGPADSAAASVRSAAWRAVLTERGAPVPDLVAGDWSAQSGFEAGMTLATDESVTAVFAANDQMALGLLRALRLAGRRVPEDVSVVGFDDMPEAAQFDPPLTTVRQNFDALGEQAVRHLVSEIERRTEAARHVVATKLIVRESTAEGH